MDVSHRQQQNLKQTWWFNFKRKVTQDKGWKNSSHWDCVWVSVLDKNSNKTQWLIVEKHVRTTSDPPCTSCSVWINNIQKHFLFPQGFWEFPEWKRKTFNYIVIVISLIIILQTLENPFKVQDRPMDFNARENKILIDMISDSMLQLTFKKLPIVEFWHSIKAKNPLFSENTIKYPSIFPLWIHICIRLDFLHLLQPK